MGASVFTLAKSLYFGKVPTMTSRELIAAATVAVEREDFVAAEDLYLQAWTQMEAGRLLEAARRQADDRAALLSTIVNAVSMLILVGLVVSL